MNKAAILKLALIGLGGGIGSIARYGVSGFIQGRWGGDFPLGTMAVNLIGCFILGVVMSLVEDRQATNGRIFLGVGFCGGFTTFSTFGYETSGLIGDRRISAAGTNVLLSVGLGLVAVALGRMAVQMLRT
jgi:CrcB protein